MCFSVFVSALCVIVVNLCIVGIAPLELIIGWDNLFWICVIVIINIEWLDEI